MTREETRNHILKIAARLFAQKGFSDTSMNDIVKESSVSKGGIYWHFKSKDEIIFAIYHSFFGEQVEGIKMLLASGDSVIDSLKSLCNLVAIALQETESAYPSPLAFYAEAAYQPQLKQRLTEYSRTYHQYLKQLLQKGIESGEFNIENVDTAAWTLITSIEGVIIIHSLSPTEQPISTYLNANLDLFLRAVISQGE